MIRTRTMAALALFLAVAFLSGCAVRHYVVAKERVDQDLTAGNQGYLAGKVPADLNAEERAAKRPTYVTEIELPFLSKKKAPAAPQGGSVSAPAQAPQSAPAVEPAPAQPVRFETYTVQKGDTLEKISKKFYGTTKRWTAIYDANKDALKGPDKIHPGQTLNIPVEKLKEPAENLK